MTPEEKTIWFNIKGIKCDNPACGWSDMEAKFDPEFWLNKPCPNCGSNLFTPEDYAALMRIYKVASFINALLAPIR